MHGQTLPSEVTYYTTTGSSAYALDNTWTIVIFIISLVVAVLGFFLIVKKKEKPQGAFMNFLREALNFRSLIIDDIIKFFYIFCTVSLTISSFVIMFQNVSNAPLVGLLLLTFGNVILRMFFELIMLLIGIWTNTSGIHKMMEQKYGDKANKEKKSEDK